MLHQILAKLLSNQRPIILGAGLYTTCRDERVIVAEPSQERLQ